MQERFSFNKTRVIYQLQRKCLIGGVLQLTVIVCCFGYCGTLLPKVNERRQVKSNIQAWNRTTTLKRYTSNNMQRQCNFGCLANKGSQRLQRTGYSSWQELIKKVLAEAAELVYNIYVR